MKSEVTLYQGDCLEYMRSMEAGSVDAVVTDPPYLDLQGGTEIKGNGVSKRIESSRSIGDEWGANLEWVMPAWNICRYGLMVFTSHHAIDKVKQAFPAKSAIGLVVWYKRNAPPVQNNVPHFNSEFVWLFKKNPGMNWKNLDTFYDVPSVQAGCFAVERILKPGSNKAAHPTQKPELLMRKLLAATKLGDTIFDPFMGSGTTGVACVQLGRNFIGCEIDPGYFAIAEKRIREAQLQMPMEAVVWQSKPEIERQAELKV